MFRRTLVPAFRANRFFSSGVQTVLVKEQNGVRELQLNNPKARNSLSMATMNELIEGITRDQDKTSLRCIVISSTGNVFSSGHNLKELTEDKGSEFHKQVFLRASELMLQIMKSPVPVIAKVDGLAAAAGCQLVATCDIAICTEQSSFSTPGANFGIFCSTPGIAVARTVNRMKASQMLLTGLPVTANEALVAGLVSQVTPKDQLDQVVAENVNAICSKSRKVIALGKEFFYKQIQMDVRSAYAEGSTTMAANLDLIDGKEGIKSFVEKRKPKWIQ